MPASINHNLMAANSACQLNAHYGRLAASTRRLSSGLRINSAEDDAAGLAIRELQRANIAALHQGARNANDAISLLQVADGALAVIDEKLIRMKELAEQAATGTYDSTQRLMIASEFQAMAAEIDRIALATDFNGLHLLDGSLSGGHDGSGLAASGKMKIHFGPGNDSAEDYYYVEIDDCTTAGLGLRVPNSQTINTVMKLPDTPGEGRYEDYISYPPFKDLNDYNGGVSVTFQTNKPNIFDVMQQEIWSVPIYGDTSTFENTILTIPKGTTNFVLNEIGTTYGANADNDIQLFTKDGKHLAGRSPIPDYGAFHNSKSDFNYLAQEVGFNPADYDASMINLGAAVQNNGETLYFTTYNGMHIGYSGDGPINYDNVARYEVLVIDEVTEDLYVWLPGVAAAVVKAYSSPKDAQNPNPPDPGQADAKASLNDPLITINTQQKAQEALVTLDEAMVKKDKIRAHLGALQNRLENTVSCLNIQAENLQAAESRISDVDVSMEMTEFVRSKVLTQSVIAMLAQSNNMPQMLMQLINNA